MPRNRFPLVALVLLAVLSLRSLGQNNTVAGAQPVPSFDEMERLGNHPVSFLFLGNQGTGGETQRRVAAGMARKVSLDPPVAAFTLGDNFFESGVTNTADAQWVTKFESVYPSDKFNFPFYTTLGNRDYVLNPDAEVQYTGKKLEDGSMTRWTMPARYWTRIFHSADDGFAIRVIGLDTPTLLGKDPDARKRELVWFDSVLASSNEQWKIVIGHHTVYSNGHFGNTLAMITQVKPVMEKYGVDIFMGGHDQDLQLLKPVNGVLYVVNGGAGASKDTRWGSNTIFAATNLGFVWIQVNRDALLLHFLDALGDTIFAHKIAKTR